LSSTEADTDRLDGESLACALRAGIHRLFGRTDHLNRINVFPVPDGDTGTNLAMTMSAVLARLDAQRTAHAGELLVRVADAALDGARGNSGAILAQFLHGVADRAGAQATIGSVEFAAATDSGARYARDALTEPREGTLLSVLTAFATELRAVARRTPGIAQALREALPALRHALAATTGELEVLRAANVVDAGAAGFVEIVEGMSAWLETGEMDTTATPPHDAPEAMAPGGAAGEHRYCTECVVNGESVDQRHLREALAGLGSSLVIAGTRRMLRIHVHTNEPAQVFAVAGRFGTLSAQKADDMHRQTQALHQHGDRRVAIVSDSAADIPEELLERLDVHFVPARVHFGSRSYLDKVSLSPQEFWHELATGGVHPQTSQPPPGDFRRMYEFLASHYTDIVSISVSGRISGTHAAASSAAARVAGGRVTVIDSLNVSLGQGLLAMYAAECAQAGQDGASVIAAVEAMRAKTHTFGLLARLDYAVRGGRVTPFVQQASRALRCSPVLTNLPDGQVKPRGVLFGRRDLPARFARYVARRLRRGAAWRIAVGHADAEQDGQRLLDALCSRVPQVESAHLTPLGTALGVHGGPGMLVVGAQEYLAPTSGRT